ncbi:unnamed protein product [Litomosoides sigmodontis]|uniref:Uncharacterized protein n=1 Tax=Litomosoides sigmodontis TaxID=42156 RepID=A0A3P6SLC7_LITSI|nr:unnamed protein product [Litomosoides sigmodontis]
MLGTVEELCSKCERDESGKEDGCISLVFRLKDHQTCPICPRRTTKESIIKRLFFTPSANVGSDVKDEDAAEVSNAETDEDANSTDNDDEELSEDGEGNGQ